jgi:hypothetical protein
MNQFYLFCLRSSDHGDAKKGCARDFFYIHGPRVARGDIRSRPDNIAIRMWVNHVNLLVKGSASPLHPLAVHFLHMKSVLAIEGHQSRVRLL